MSEIDIAYDETEPIATVTIVNPDRRNAMDVALSQELAEAMHTLDGDDSVRCVIITGEGDAFCAGADLAATGGSPTTSSIDRSFHAAVREILTCSKPVVAKVSGPAVGGGASLAVAPDYVYAGESARIGFVFASLGLTADTGATFVLPRLVGVRTAMDLLTSAEILDAREAHDVGLTTAVVPDDDLDGRVRERAVELANGPTRAYAALRRLLLRSGANTLEEQLELESREQEILFHTDDVAEGLSAFMADREPDFAGR